MGACRQIRPGAVVRAALARICPCTHTSSVHAYRRRRQAQLGNYFHDGRANRHPHTHTCARAYSRADTRENRNTSASVVPTVRRWRGVEGAHTYSTAHTHTHAHIRRPGDGSGRRKPHARLQMHLCVQMYAKLRCILLRLRLRT